MGVRIMTQRKLRNDFSKGSGSYLLNSGYKNKKDEKKIIQPKYKNTKITDYLKVPSQAEGAVHESHDWDEASPAPPSSTSQLQQPTSTPTKTRNIHNLKTKYKNMDVNGY